ncbi:MAG TPA: thioesterase family protein [bacterium]|nr:thioesterase family protein [bacterium]HQG45526.1 thioesterase family protein [bacterium]HQI48391.1 thioesterase family protein [bacterium]HQJ64479.1 thioesterase family protein [bacterium]
MATHFVTSVRVRSYELDSFGHVNNAIYLQYLEYARSEYLLQVGISFSDFQRWNAFPYVVRAEIDYKASSRYDDELKITGWVSAWGKSSFVLSYEVFNKSAGRMGALAEIKFAWVDRDEKIIRIPPIFRERMT